MTFKINFWKLNVLDNNVGSKLKGEGGLTYHKLQHYLKIAVHDKCQAIVMGNRTENHNEIIQY